MVVSETGEPSARELATLAQKVLCQSSEFLVDTRPDEE